MNKLYAQLWSVQDYAKKDFFATLEQIAKAGYTGVEFAGYFDISAKDMLTKLQELGLTAISSHVGINGLTANIDKEIEYLTTLGAKYIVCPGADIKTIDGALAHVELFNQFGEKAAKAGLTFAYHNHDFEFALDNGQYPLEVLFDNCDPKFVKQQPDVYWVAYAGLDPMEYIKQHKDRCPIIHLKQLENMTTKANVEAGKGSIDFHAMMQLAEGADFVYEQEEFIGDSMEEMGKSIKFILGNNINKV